MIKSNRPPTGSKPKNKKGIKRLMVPNQASSEVLSSKMTQAVGQQTSAQIKQLGAVPAEI